MKHLKTYEIMIEEDYSDLDSGADPYGEIEYTEFPYEPMNVPIPSTETREERERRIKDMFPYEPMNVPKQSTGTREERAKKIIDQFPYEPIIQTRGDGLSREERERAIIKRFPEK